MASHIKIKTRKWRWATVIGLGVWSAPVMVFTFSTTVRKWFYLLLVWVLVEWECIWINQQGLCPSTEFLMTDRTTSIPTKQPSLRLSILLFNFTQSLLPFILNSSNQPFKCIFSQCTLKVLALISISPSHSYTWRWSIMVVLLLKA